MIDELDKLISGWMDDGGSQEALVKAFTDKINAYNKQVQEEKLFQEKKKFFNIMIGGILDYIERFGTEDARALVAEYADAELTDEDYIKSIKAFDEMVAGLGMLNKMGDFVLEGVASFAEPDTSAKFKAKSKSELTPDQRITEWLRKNNL